MAIVSVSRMQVRRGLIENLPQLASGELGWAIDERRLFVGNGTLEEGAPFIGNTEVLTVEGGTEVILGLYIIGAGGEVTLLGGQTNVDAGISFPVNTYQGIHMEYQIVRDTRKRSGTIRLALDATFQSFDDEYTESNQDLGVDFNLRYASGVVYLTYTSTAGAEALLKYSLRSFT
jgi:hypothetical protein